MPVVKLFALVLTVPVIELVPPAASVPLVGEAVNQLALLRTDQLIDAFPAFVSTKVMTGGLNGPPSYPEEMGPAPGFTIRIGPDV